MEKSFTALSIADIAALNKNALKDFGGFFSELDKNFHNKESLQYTLEACIFPLFGKAIYPTIHEKISAIVQTIICGHVFHDGNKRTALSVAVALYEENGYIFSPTKADEDFFVRIATDNLTVEEICTWLKERVRPFPCR